MLLLVALNCSDDTPTEVVDELRPVISTPVSGTMTSRLRVDVEGSAEPNRTIELILDDFVSSYTTYSDANGTFSFDSFPVAGHGGHAVWARLSGDTTRVSEPVLITVDYELLNAPLILFPPHGASIPAARVPIAGFTPHGVSEVEIIKDGSVMATAPVTDNSFYLSGLDPVGTGTTYLWTRGIFSSGGYTAYGESIAVEFGGGDNPAIISVSQPEHDGTVSSGELAVELSATGLSPFTLMVDGRLTGIREVPEGGIVAFPLQSVYRSGPVLLGIATHRNGGMVAEECIRVYVDLSAPFPPTIILPEDGEVFRAGNVHVLGASESGITVYLKLNDEWADTTETEENGSFSFDLALPGDGSYSIAAMAEDGAGNMSLLSDEVSITIDQSAPEPPGISVPVEGTLVTADSTRIAGWAQGGTLLSILINDGIVHETTIGVDNSYDLNVKTPDVDGRHRISVRSSAGGDTGWIRGDSVAVFVDRNPPPAPIISQPAESSYVSAESILVSGFSEPSASVIVTVDDTDDYSVQSNASGFWSTWIETPENDGVMSLEAGAMDTAGFQGPVGESYLLFVDKTSPSLVILSPGSDTTFTGNPVVIRGQTELDASVTVDGKITGVDESGIFQRSVTIAEGTDTVTVIATDPAGNTAEIGHILRLDTTPPFITVTSPADSLITQSINVMVSGMTEVGSSLTIQSSPVTVEPDGSFSGGVSLSFGWNTITVTSEDVVGWRTTIQRTVIVDAQPTNPSNLEPDDGELVSSGRPVLRMDPASDANGDDLTYSVMIYEDEELSRLVSFTTSLSDETGDVTWVVQPELSLNGSTLYWRARAFDGVLYGPWSGTVTFTLPDIGSRNPHRFFGYGDSITEGAQTYNGGWIPTVGYREDLELALSIFFGGAVVDRLYVPGGSSYNGAEEIEDDLATENAGYLLLLFGAIDALQEDMNAAESASNIISCADYARSQGFIVIIGTVPPQLNEVTNQRVQQLNTQIRQMASNGGFIVSDHYLALINAAAGDLMNVICEDGIHPSDLGYSVMAETWYKAITGSDDFPVPGAMNRAVVSTVSER